MGIKFCAQQTIISRQKKKKRKGGRIMRYGNHDSDSGASSTVKYLQKKEELNFEPMLDY
jgi:hypothetical protein